MANSRIVNTNFWRDAYISELEPLEMFLFLYFLTSPKTTLAGIYEITMREIEFDTHLTKAIIKPALQKFQMDGKIYYQRNWIVLTNFIKHQRLNPSMLKGIKRAISELPDWLQDMISLEEDKEQGQQSLFMAVNSTEDNSLGTVWGEGGTPNLTKPNLTKLNLIKQKETAEADGNKEITEKQKKRNYAIAMDKEREQEKRTHKAFERNRVSPHNVAKTMMVSTADIEAAYKRREMEL